VLAATVAGISLAALLYLTTRHFAARMAFFGRALRIDLPLLYPSIAAVVAYLFFSLKTAAADAHLFDLGRLLKAIRWKRAAAAVFLLVLMKFITHRLASGQDIVQVSMTSVVVYTLLASLTEPLLFFIAHVVYYGPVMLLLLFFWRPFCESLQEFGPGLRILVILNVILSVNPQSRFQINVVTVFVMLLVRLLDRRGLRYESLPFWALLCLFYSKVWYTFNTAPQIDDGTMDALQGFPLQHYFMSSGSWMSASMYYVQGGVVVLTAVVLYILVKQHGDRPATGGWLADVPGVSSGRA